MAGTELNKVEISKFIRRWFKNINDHASLEEIVPMLAPAGFEMVFPEATLTNEKEFAEWYYSVTHKFFDQRHNVKNWETEIEGDQAKITVNVNWQARTWEPPQAYSQHLDFDAVQSWVIVRDANNGNLVIKKYIVEALEPN